MLSEIVSNPLKLHLEKVKSIHARDLKASYDIRTVQDLLGHKNVSTTMFYTHVLNKGGKGVQSPGDMLWS